MVPQPLSREEIWDDVSEWLEKTRKMWHSQRHLASTHWLSNMREQFKSGFKCVDDNLRHENHRTLPKTNETDHRGQPLPRNVIGYMYFDK